MSAHTHRWPRATIADPNYVIICACGNLKTDQALTCFDCAVERRRADDHYDRRTCPECGGSKHKDANRCRLCENAARAGDPRWYFGAGGGSEEHPWRKSNELIQQSLFA